MKYEYVKDLCFEMLADNYPIDFVMDVFFLAVHKINSVNGLLLLWSQEDDELTRSEIIIDLRQSIDEYKTSVLNIRRCI